MKTIHLIRHAKSSWDTPGLADNLRPLNERGIRACTLMAPQLATVGCDFDHIFCSSAVRAQATISLIAQALPSQSIHWEVDKTLYTFDYKQLLLWLSKLNNTLTSVTIIGHNPAFTTLLNYLSTAEIKNLPTCAYAQLNNSHLDNWQSIKLATFQLDLFITPKTVMSKGYA